MDSDGTQAEGRLAPLENAPAFPSAQGEGGTQGPGPEVLEAAHQETLWEADIVRLPWTIHEDPGALPSLLAVMAGPYLLGTDVLRKPSGDPYEVAVLLAGALEESARLLGGWPRRVRVRQEEVADALRPVLDETTVEVESSSYLVHLDHMTRHLVRAHGAPEGKLVYSFPGTWASWGLPEPLVRELFQAASELHEAAPWNTLVGQRGLEARLPDGRTWYVALLEPRRMPAGLSVYEDPDDLVAAGIASSPEEVARSIRGRFYTLLFGPSSELPDPMRQEIEDNAWTVANENASPFLMAVNTPGGVIRESDGKDLVTLLRTLTALGRHAHDDLEGQDVGAGWRDSSTGVRLGFMDVAGLARSLQVAVDRQNRSPRAEFGGLSSAQVHQLLTSDWMDREGALAMNRHLEPQEVKGTRMVKNAGVFLSAVQELGGAPATRNGNLGRAFVHRMLEELDWSPARRFERMGAPEKAVKEADFPTLGTLRALLEVSGLLERQGPRFVATELATELVGGGHWTRLHLRLFDGFFRRLDLSDLRPEEIGREFQESVPYALFRFASVGRGWATPEALVSELLLPPVREGLEHQEAEMAAVPGLAGRVLEWCFLSPLEDFGLAQGREDTNDTAIPDRSYRKTELFDRFLRFSPGLG